MPLSDFTRWRLANQAADRRITRVMAHSQRDGRYFTISDLHWGFGPHDPLEDFGHDDTFAKMLRWITHDPQNESRNKTLIIAGDWFEFATHVGADAPLARQREVLTSILNGHLTAVQALARAVVDGGLRVVYLRGNHDMPIVDPRIRAHLLCQIATLCRLTAREQRTLARNIAFSGFATPLGAFGEGLVLHGSDQSPVNSWRMPANPYDGKRRRLQWSVGWKVSQAYGRLRDERLLPGDRETTVADMMRLKVARICARPVAEAIRKVPAPSREEATRCQEHDREALRGWVERTRFAELMDGEGAQTVDRWTTAWQDVFRRMPVPLHERMVNRHPLGNLGRLVLAILNLPRTEKPAIAQLISTFSGAAGRLRVVESGHTHHETWSVGHVDGIDEPVSFNDSGSWARGSHLNLVTVDTDRAGHLVGVPTSWRVDPATGAASIPTPPAARKPKLGVPGWTPRRPND